ncbi:hypothetical protein Cni_G19194 [Canna indica]|uniref:J domain-containing protein n=1 Tax=Canna indica TaxID=4628 RepID=A0AAQ3QGQ6_9LILI|nr:hypothetical protein Cni_G19194 [Canna indica]
MSKGQSQPRSHSGRRALGRCKSKTVEIIDVDKGKADVVIIDAPESSHQGCACSRAKSVDNPAVIIRIDDEEGDIEETASNAGHNFSDNRACPVFANHPLQEELDNDECLMFHAKGLSPSNLCANARFVFVPPGGHYEICSSESSSSESDSSECDIYESENSDCEVMEGSSEQWQRASLRRKTSQKVRFGSEDLASASGSSADPGCPSSEPNQNMIDLDDCINESSSVHCKASFHTCDPSCSNNGKDGSLNMTNDNGFDGDHFLGSNRRVSCANSDICTEIRNEGLSFDKEKTFPPHNQQSQFADTHNNDLNNTSAPDTQMEENIHFTVDGFSSMEEAEKATSGNSFCTNTIQVEDILAEGAPYPGKPSEASEAIHSVSNSAGAENQREDNLYSQPPHGTAAGHEIMEAKEKSFVEQTPPKRESLLNESQFKHGNCCFSYDMENTCTESASTNNAGNAASSRNSSLRIDSRHLSLSKGDLTVDQEKHSEYVMKQKVPQSQSDITGDREKHKESDEYKRAVKEEWASRMREIQIQAEEAQRLRKRRKAESLRLLDMEKRQKQRVQEIRESQKKDEEVINQKELLRAEVRKELDKMEGRYTDMASLLRGLGIRVEGGPFPLSHEVNAAYKQALLRFHPDRASRTDIRKQVEAEETFKLISRLKEKLLPVA